MHGRKRAKRSFYRQSLEARKKRKVQRTNQPADETEHSQGVQSQCYIQK